MSKYKLYAASSEVTEALRLAISVIQLDRNLEHIKLRMDDDCTDETGMAFVEADCPQKYHAPNSLARETSFYWLPIAQ
jgi:hypothetical protein